jgi:hypothetical protein
VLLPVGGPIDAHKGHSMGGHLHRFVRRTRGPRLKVDLQSKSMGIEENLEEHRNFQDLTNGPPKKICDGAMRGI